MTYSKRHLTRLAWLAVGLPAGLSAGTIGFGTSVQVGANQVSVGVATVQITNGLQQGPATTNGGGTVTGGGSQVYTFATASAGAAATFGSADLASGALRTTSTNSSAVSGREAGAQTTATFNDTLTFTNTTGAYLYLSLEEVITGTVSVVHPGSLSASNSTFVSFAAGGNDQFMVMENGAMVFGLGESIYYRMVGDDTNGVRVTFEDQNAKNSFTNTSTGGVGAIMSTVIGFHPGETTLSVSALSALDCRFTTSCDYGNTAKFEFGDLPTGLTYTSASGVFLTAAQTTATPEPSTMLFLSGGLLTLGLLKRR